MPPPPSDPLTFGDSASIKGLMSAFIAPSALRKTRPLGPLPKHTDWAYALAGGGAKGAFQLGAVQCLFRDVRYRPVGIASTSVGSVNAVAIAENSPEGLDKLTTTWLSLTSVHDMYEAEPWIGTVDSLHTFQDILRINLLNELLAASPRSIDSFNPDPNSAPEDRLNDSLRSALSFIPMPGLIPGTTLFGAPALAPILATAWPMLPFLVDEVGDFFREILNDVVRVETLLRDDARGLFNFSPLAKLLRNNADFAAIQRAGTRLRILMVALEDSCVYAMNERLELIRYTWNQQQLRIEAAPSPIQLRTGSPVDRLITAVLASSSLPLINVPIAIGDPLSINLGIATITTNPFHMVDGGVRDTLPIMQALETVDPRPGRQPGVLAIGTGAAHPSRSSITLPELQEPGVSLDKFGMATIGGIAFETLVDEVYLSDLQQLGTLPDDVDRLAIMPANTVGETSDIDPGMVQILIAYGWMRAYDVIRQRELELSDEDYINRLWGITEQITQARVAVWTLERQGISFQHEWPGIRISRSGMLEPLPSGWHFPTERKVGNLILSRSGTDLVERIRILKRTIRDLLTMRITFNGLDSVPSMHELSDFTVGNINCFGEWYTDWERHGLSPGSIQFPTGPGLLSPSDNQLDPFGRHATPWQAQHRFTTKLYPTRDGRLPRDRINKVDLSTTEFFDTPAAVMEPAWFCNASGYCVVRHEGYCYKASEEDPPSGTTPLFLMTNVISLFPLTEKHLTTSRTTMLGFGSPIRLGYVYKPERPQPSGTVPLLTYRSELLNDYMTTADYTRFVEGNPFEKDEWRAREPIRPDYVLDKVEGFVYPPPHTATGLAPLYRWMRFMIPDSLTTSQPEFIPMLDGRPVSN